LNFRRL